MRRSQRYEVISAWTEVERETVQTNDWLTDTQPSVLVIREVADIRDTQGGYEYRDGAWRVRSFQDGKSYKRAQTFYGELAWADSQRLYDDIRSEVFYGRAS